MSTRASAALPLRPTPDLAAEPPRLDLLTIFRFTAAFWVLVFHLITKFPVPLADPFHSLALNGAYAMSFFFVLSGTVLAYSYFSLGESPADLRRFYLARFARVYPAYLLIHLIGLPFLDTPFEDLPRWAYLNLTSLLGVQAWFPQAFEGVNTGTWSISVEYFFYLLFPALLPLVRLLDTPARRRYTAGALIILVGFLGLADAAFTSRMAFPLVYTSPLIRLPEFLLGMLVGVSLRQRDLRPASGITLLLAALVFLTVSCNPIHYIGLWTRANLIIVPAVAWLIYTAARFELAHPGRFRSGLWRGAEYLGRASYCIFLVQMPILLWIDQAKEARHPLIAAFSAQPLLGLLTGITAILALGLLAHETIEKPLHRRLRSRPRSRALSPAPAASTT